MIYLENDSIRIKVMKENPIYDTLLKFSNESFLVKVEEEIKNTIKENTREEIKYVKKELDRSKVWEDFNDYFEEYLDPPTMFANVLKSHVYSVLDGESGVTMLDQESENLYKKNDLYLLYRKD